VIGVDIELPDVTSGIFVRADAARLPFHSNTFDGALLKDIVEHVTGPTIVGAGLIMTPYRRSKTDPLSRGPTTFSGLDTSLAWPTSADRERELDQRGRVGRDQKAAPG
jgi:hypothetical protein